MKDILSVEGRHIFDELAAARALLAFDFDGSLAPFVDARSSAEVPASTRRLLRALSLLYPCAVISGRSRSDVLARLAGIPLLAVVGTHGAEAGHGPVDRTRRGRVVAWKRALAPDLALVPGIEIEDKVFSVAVHFRNSPSIAAARRLVLEAASKLDGARVVRGRAVVNVIPADAPDKAAAVAALVERAGPRPVFYLGDDRSDEDVFLSSRVHVAVRVGRTARSAAPWYVARQGDVEEVLRRLLDARTRLDGMGERAEALARAVGP